MLAIETHYIGPTDYRGSRVVAQVMETAREGQPVRKVVLGWDDAFGSDDNHRAAATALIRKLEWTADHGYGPWIVGASVKGYVFVCDTKHGSDRMVVHDTPAE